MLRARPRARHNSCTSEAGSIHQGGATASSLDSSQITSEACSIPIRNGSVCALSVQSAAGGRTRLPLRSSPAARMQGLRRNRSAQRIPVFSPSMTMRSNFVELRVMRFNPSARSDLGRVYRGSCSAILSFRSRAVPARGGKLLRYHAESLELSASCVCEIEKVLLP